MVVKGKFFQPVDKFKSNLPNFIYFCLKLSNLNEKSSKFQIKLAKKLGLLSEGSDISLSSALEGREISMLHSNSESL